MCDFFFFPPPKAIERTSILVADDIEAKPANCFSPPPADTEGYPGVLNAADGQHSTSHRYWIAIRFDPRSGLWLMPRQPDSKVCQR